jgi:hypothetical protein
MIEREYWIFVDNEYEDIKISSSFLSRDYIWQVCSVFLSSCDPIHKDRFFVNQQWPEKDVRWQSTNRTVAILLVFFSSSSSSSSSSLLLVLLSPVTCTYSYVTIAALDRRRPLHTNIHTRERASNHSILLTTTTTTIHRIVYVCVYLIGRSLSLRLADSC